MPHNEHHEKLTMDMVHLLNDLPVCSQLLLLFTSSAVPPPTQPGGPDYDDALRWVPDPELGNGEEEKQVIN